MDTPDAEYWHVEDGGVVCDLCPHRCRIVEGRAGRCRVRRVAGGRLTAASYGRITSAQIDPIEKKPLYHFKPGSAIFSMGGWGCNFACDFCQNWSISQRFEDSGETAVPAAVLAAVGRAGTGQIAYTYNEPLVNFEFVRDCSRLMRARGYANVLITNGFVEEAPAAELLELTDAVNLDIKSLADGFYRRHCGGRLAPVLHFARQARAAGCHLEITHLLVPDEDTGTDAVARLADWIALNLGADTPLHISAYHPQYRLGAAATPPDRMLAAHAAAAARLRFVYLGNLRTDAGRDTLCPACGRVWIRRGADYGGVSILSDGLRQGCCAGCGASAAVRL